MLKVCILTTLILAALAVAASVEDFNDPFLSGLMLGEDRETVKEALQDEGYKLSWDEWCLWGTRDDIYDIAYCFGEYGELKSIEYHQRCPGDTWFGVYLERRDEFIDIYGPSAGETDGEADYWSAGRYEIEMGLKYLDEADGLDPLIYIYITD